MAATRVSRRLARARSPATPAFRRTTEAARAVEAATATSAAHTSRPVSGRKATPVATEPIAIAE